MKNKQTRKKEIKKLTKKIIKIKKNNGGSCGCQKNIGTSKLNQDLEKKLLLSYDITDLINVCSVNKETKILCEKDPQIKEKIRNKHQELKEYFKNTMAPYYAGALAENSNPKTMKLIEEILKKKPNLIKNFANHLSNNPLDEALDILLKPNNKQYINYSNLSENTNDRAVELLIQNPEKIYWFAFSVNSSDKAIDFYYQKQNGGYNTDSEYDSEYNSDEQYNHDSDEEQYDHDSDEEHEDRDSDEEHENNFGLLSIEGLCHNENPRATEILNRNLDKLDEYDWSNLSRVNNELAVDLILLNIDQINEVSELSENENDKAVSYLLENPYAIDTFKFSRNSNTKAVEYMINNPNKIYLPSFCHNKNNKAIEHIKKKYIKQIHSIYLIGNPNKKAFLLFKEIIDFKNFRTRASMYHIFANPNFIDLVYEDVSFLNKVIQHYKSVK